MRPMQDVAFQVRFHLYIVGPGFVLTFINATTCTSTGCTSTSTRTVMPLKIRGHSICDVVLSKTFLTLSQRYSNDEFFSRHQPPTIIF
jgi:hypothetical protein